MWLDVLLSIEIAQGSFDCSTILEETTIALAGEYGLLATQAITAACAVYNGATSKRSLQA